ncbi:MAG: hypothetical protein R2882_14210 [Gemmatimonadales bacterium]
MPLALGRAAEELRILKVAAVDRAAFAGSSGARWRRPPRGARPGRDPLPDGVSREAYADLIDLGFRVHWTDLRMVLHERPERPPTSGVVFSNWEI